MILLDTDKDKLAESNGNAKTTFGILSYDGFFRMNTEHNNTTSWNCSEMRTVRMERILRLLPEPLHNNVKSIVKRTSAGGSSKDIITTTDKCFLFSEIEIFGEAKYSFPGEGEQYEYFAIAANGIFDDYKWLRSPYYNGSRIFCYVCDDDGRNCDYAGYSHGVAFGFCI